MRFIPILTLGALLSACGAPPSQPTPTIPSPPSLPTQTAARTAEPTRPSAPASSLDVKNVNQGKRGANEVVTTADITTQQNLGLGDIETSSPETMIVGETRIVKLRLSPATQLVSSKKEPAKKPLPNSPDFVFKFTGSVDLYPVMIAELRALAFDITPVGRVQRVVDSTSPVTWDWVIRAKDPGWHELSLGISIPAIINGVESELGKALQDLALVITVQPQPGSMTNRILESIANNAGAIVVALIGLFGTIIGIVLKMRSDNKPRKRDGG